MKLRMLSLVSIILALSIKSMDISAKDYHELRVLARAIPSSPYVPSIMPMSLTSEVDSIVNQLASANSIMEMHVVDFDVVTPEFTAYAELKSIASEKELNDLLYHPSPIVKVYAYRAILVNGMHIDVDAELALLKDSTCIDWYAGNIMTSTTVREFVQTPFYE